MSTERGEDASLYYSKSPPKEEGGEENFDGREQDFGRVNFIPVVDANCESPNANIVTNTTTDTRVRMDMDEYCHESEFGRTRMFSKDEPPSYEINENLYHGNIPSNEIQDSTNDSRIVGDSGDFRIANDCSTHGTNAVGNGVARDIVEESFVGNPGTASALGYPTANESWKRIASRGTSISTSIHSTIITDTKFPCDCYSFLALHSPRDNIIFFLFGFIPFIFQIIFFVLLLWSVMDEKRGTIGETDNPDEDFFAQFIPANASMIVRWTQVTSLVAYVIFPSSSILDMARAIQMFPRRSQVEKGDPVGCMVFSCLLRGIQGFLGVLAVFFLVIPAETVIDIILNFTAVNFISQLDEVAFVLALSGEFGPILRAEAAKVANKELPSCMYKKAKHVYFKAVAGMLSLFLLGTMTFVIIFQNSSNVWVTEILRVQFQEETGLTEYNGCYRINDDRSTISSSRRIYNSFDDGPKTSTFGYCRENRQWLLFDGNGPDPCDAINTWVERARSSKTDSFDISTVFDSSWVSASNTPLDLYFFDGESEADIEKHCDIFLEDGICDLPFNEGGYGYDGGDCCAATCSQFNCGRGGLTIVFGNVNASGDGYQNCKDPTMFPITIHLNDMSRNNDPKYTGIGHESFWADSFEGRRFFSFDEQVFKDWLEAPPLNTFLSLDCDGKNVVTVYIEPSMVNKTQQVMVEDGATCTVVARNMTGQNVFIGDPTWIVNYTIFHENANRDDRVEIMTTSSFEQEQVDFVRIPSCYFSKLQNHIDIDLIYTASPNQSHSKGAIDWLMESKEAKSQCENIDFIERYALVALHFAMKPGVPFISRSPQCTWSSILCGEGTVIAFAPSDHGLRGAIPSELALLTSLERLDFTQNKITTLPKNIFSLTNLSVLDLTGNELSGEIPSEIGLLTSLTQLYLGRNDLTGRIPSEIGLLTSMVALDLKQNGLSGAIPSEIGFLTRLSNLYLKENKLSDSIPSAIGLLTNLARLYLPGNELRGEIPSEIGLLTSLTQLYLGRNKLIGPIPREIGLLTKLSEMALVTNKLSGTIPSEIGLLRSLSELYLRVNDLSGAIPSEIGLLTKLSRLEMKENNLSGAIPSEIGLLTNLSALDLTGNELSGAIPSEIGLLSSLTKLSLKGNLITAIPSEIELLTNLESIDIYIDDNITFV